MVAPQVNAVVSLVQFQVRASNLTYYLALLGACVKAMATAIILRTHRATNVWAIIEDACVRRDGYDEELIGFANDLVGVTCGQATGVCCYGSESNAHLATLPTF